MQVVFQCVLSGLFCLPSVAIRQVVPILCAIDMFNVTTSLIIRLKSDPGLFSSPP